MLNVLSLALSLSLCVSLSPSLPPSLPPWCECVWLFKGIEHPVRTNQIPRQIPEQSFYTKPFPGIIMGGILPFGCIFIQLFFILNSIWWEWKQRFDYFCSQQVRIHLARSVFATRFKYVSLSISLLVFSCGKFSQEICGSLTFLSNSAHK